MGTGYAGMQVRQCLWTGGFFMTLDVYKGATTPVIGKGLATDIIAGFLAGATGVAFNCWTDVCRSVVQKEALTATFDPTIPRPSAITAYSPGPFVAQIGKIYAAKGLMGGLYAGVGPKMIHLG